MSEAEHGLIACDGLLQQLCGEALAIISVDDGADAEVRRKLLELPDVRSATIVTFRGE